MKERLCEGAVMDTWQTTRQILIELCSPSYHHLFWEQLSVLDFQLGARAPSAVWFSWYFLGGTHTSHNAGAGSFLNACWL